MMILVDLDSIGLFLNSFMISGSRINPAVVTCRRLNQQNEDVFPAATTWRQTLQLVEKWHSCCLKVRWNRSNSISLHQVLQSTLTWNSKWAAAQSSVWVYTGGVQVQDWVQGSSVPAALWARHTITVIKCIIYKQDWLKTWYVAGRVTVRTVLSSSQEKSRMSSGVTHSQVSSTEFLFYWFHSLS